MYIGDAHVQFQVPGVILFISLPLKWWKSCTQTFGHVFNSFFLIFVDFSKINGTTDRCSSKFKSAHMGLPVFGKCVSSSKNAESCISEWVSRFLTALQHNLGHLVPLKVKNDERESNHKTMLQQSTRIHWREKLKM